MVICKSKSTKKLKDPYSQDSFSSFLNSANNIEYVLLILSQINQYLEEEISKVHEVEFYDDNDISDQISSKVDYIHTQ